MKSWLEIQEEIQAENRMEIRAVFMGEGQIFLNGEPLAFPYMKVKLLLFMLLEARGATRGQLCAWLWEEYPATARQNLRNALAALRRLLPEGCLAADRLTVRIDERCRVVSDLDGPAKDAFAAPFLDGLIRAGVQCGWVEERREHYRKKFLRPPIHETGESPKPSELFVRVKERDTILAFLDEARDPEGESLCSIVLGEEGSGKSVLVKEVFARKKEDSICFRGRCREDENGRRVPWEGILKAAAGGRPLLELGLSAFHFRYLTSCFPDLFSNPGQEIPSASHSRTYSSHSSHSSSLIDFNPHLLGKIFALLFDEIHRRTRRQVFLLLEDIHCSGRLIPDILRGLFENARKGFSALLTCYPEFRPQLDIALGVSGLRLREISLDRLSLEQTALICRGAISEDRLTPSKLAEIYEHTGGSPFLLQEFLRFCDAEDWSSKLAKSLHEVVNRRILSLSDEEADLLDCAAVFPARLPSTR
jgi:predicted ATPase